jgi:Xaa-Pro dipeptidase
MIRYQAIAEESARILTGLAEWVEPGMTERHVYAEMWKRYLENGFAGMFMFVGADERIQKYRHPVPSDKTIERVVIFAPTGIKHGLATLSTRMVYFGEPPQDIRKRHHAVATLQAAMLTETRPGARMNALLNRIFELYSDLGYAEETYNHFHGGPTNYRGSYPEPMQDADAIVEANSSFSYYLTLTGAKSEDLILVTEDETRIASLDSRWPMLDVSYQDNTIAIPDILVR